MEQEFQATGILGKGGFASVIAVRDSKGREYALKKPFHKKAYIDASSGAINMKELYIMTHIKHPYIQGALRVYFSDPCPRDNNFLSQSESYDRMFFLMDKAEYSCHELVRRFRAPISHVKRALFQTACAIQHLHSYGICHRDIKPSNILCFYKNGVLTAKLTDFGMTKPINFVARHSLHAGTAYYRAPELILQNSEYDLSMDVWSFGCTMFEMVARDPIFKGNTDIDVLTSIFTKRGSPTPDVFRKIAGPNMQFAVGRHRSKTITTLMKLPLNDRQLFDMPVIDNLYNPGNFSDFCHLLERMIQIDPELRPDMIEVMNSSFFSDFFTRHDLDYTLWRPNKKDFSRTARDVENMNIVQVFPSAHSEHWTKGAHVFVDFDPTDKIKYTHEISYSIRFHGLDIYCRVLNKIDPMNDPTQYIIIAWCAGYIASKFFLDEASEHMWDIFPESYDEIDTATIEKYERAILQILDFEIYRPTCFTYLKHRAFYATLFILMLSGNLMYDRPLKRVMEIVNAEIALTIKHNDPGSIPLE